MRFASVPGNRQQSGNLDEDRRLSRSLSMSEESINLRSQARRCRRLAEYVSSDQDQAMLKRVAKDFEEAAKELERNSS